MDNNSNILGIKEINRLYEMNDRQQAEIESDIQRIEGDMQLRTMSMEMCRIMESYIGLHGQDDDTVEEKRFRIMGAENERTPYTLEVLVKRLDETVGSGRTKVIVANGFLIASIALENKKFLNYVKSMLEEIVPLDMMIEVNIIWNTYGALKEHTHAHLGEFKNMEIREEMLV